MRGAGRKAARRGSIRRARLPRPARLALFVSLLFLSGSCVIGHYREGNPVPFEAIERIRPGTTTKQEILAWFGPPQNYTSASLLEQLVVSDEIPPGTVPPYRFSDVLAYQIHYGEMRGLFLLLFNTANIEVRSDHLVIFFDKEDVVRYYGVRRADDP